MKRVLVIICLLLLALGCNVSAEIQFLSVEITNTGDTVLQSLIPITTIYPGRDKILGYTVMSAGDGTNTESYIGIYDSAISNLNDLEVIDEAESSDVTSINVWFPHSREISNGIVVRQGANTIARIIFERG